MGGSSDAGAGAGGQPPMTLDRWFRVGTSGAICAMITHVYVIPVDVVKTRMQLTPGVYSSLTDGVKTITRTEGVRALTTGFGATFGGYFVQGALKYGNYELLKSVFSNVLGSDFATTHRLAVYMASAAMSEVVADVALTPFEAIRIRMVADPAYSKNMFAGLSKMYQESGIMKGWYRGFPPLVLKQVPYTAVQLSVFEKSLEFVYTNILNSKKKSDWSAPTQLSVSLACGAAAGVASAIASHPADTVLSKINKGFKAAAAAHSADGAGQQQKSQGMWKYTFQMLRETQANGQLWAGLGPRIVMMTAMVAGQLLIYDTVKVALGLGASGTVVPDKK
ncbi:mitochondrial solute carrier family 25 (mitochondrial phosphate transporter) member 3 [Andalucia godoyi]|uniref:Mitochondrial solute carrier family 25 (Mitochondrial phosphate transporter) member 3 n=1 Tax=Andalucia godoyi TaxID=505711 RepID=A0A8K0F4K4_ANDGO|nr:mitochondrial solute carrier family 25 (mitochondrial phosphate transporter) member 3 [Andalucia godoyi]|eukprot:ANDGO_02739.mRNA.1 mitochondrial solute carrier family 25 (mitochondrial phosphate transporter) member 3